VVGFPSEPRGIYRIPTQFPFEFCVRSFFSDCVGSLSRFRRSGFLHGSYSFRPRVTMFAYPFLLCGFHFRFPHDIFWFPTRYTVFTDSYKDSAFNSVLGSLLSGSYSEGSAFQSQYPTLKQPVPEISKIKRGKKCEGLSFHPQVTTNFGIIRPTPYRTMNSALLLVRGLCTSKSGRQ
jgi:hypothetical protein